MVETKTETKTVPTAVVANRVAENIYFDGDEVAVYGDFDDDGCTADFDRFADAIEALDDNDFDAIRVGSLTIVDDGYEAGNGTAHLSVLHHDNQTGAGRQTSMGELKDAIETARETF
jgi:hypothetical protein